MGKLESTSVLTTDTIFSWQQQEHRINCQCRLRIYQFSLDQVVVITSALPDHPGASFSPMVQHLIDQVGSRFGIVPGKTMWIEHYPQFSSGNLEFYYQVLMVKDQVSWHKITQNQLEYLLGQKI